MNKKQIIKATGLFALFAASPAFSQTTNIEVVLNVQGSCEINGPGSGNSIQNINPVIYFGSIFNPTAQTTPLDASTDTVGGVPISVLCNATSNNPTFTIMNGTYDASGSLRMRNVQLTPGAQGEFISYDLYGDAGRTSKYQFGIPMSINGGRITAGTRFILTVYGRIPLAQIQSAVAGDYVDQVVAELAL